VDPYWEGWVDWMRAQGWRRFGWYVWDQGPGLPGDWNGRLAPSHEFIFHFNRQPRKPNKTVESKHAGETLGGGGLRGADGTVHRKTGFGNAIQSHRIPDSVFRIMRHKGGLGAAGSHPAVFPVALVEAVLEAFTDPGDLVFEPFCGSGTQLIAAERTGRRCCAVELDPVYCDVAVRRWEMATGRHAHGVCQPASCLDDLGDDAPRALKQRDDLRLLGASADGDRLLRVRSRRSSVRVPRPVAASPSARWRRRWPPPARSRWLPARPRWRSAWCRGHRRSRARAARRGGGRHRPRQASRA
jgi:hypothetical protein